MLSDDTGKYVPKNSELYWAIRAYVEAAIAKARELTTVLGVKPVYKFEAFPYVEFNAAIQTLPEFEPCLNAIMADEVINSHLGVLIGRATLSRISLEPQILMSELPRLGIYRNEISFNEVFFEQEFENFEIGFHEEGLQYEVIAPLLGIQFEKAFCLDDVEVCLVDAVHLTKPLLKTVNSEITRFECRWALRTVYTIPKRIGDQEFDPIAEKNKEDSIRHAANEKIDRTVAILRLLRGETVSAIERIHRTRNWFFNDLRVHNARFEPETQLSLVTGEEFEKAIRDLWKTIGDGSIAENLKVAIKRFSYAHERMDWEDQIIDLAIAGEAIFLSPNNKDELTYRLRLNAALFMGSDKESRSRIFSDFKLAYDLRSRLVHGSDPKDVLKRIRREVSGQFGDEQRLAEFTARFRDYIRFALVRMIRLSAAGHGLHTANDWDVLALGISEWDPDETLVVGDDDGQR